MTSLVFKYLKSHLQSKAETLECQMLCAVQYYSLNFDITIHEHVNCEFWSPSIWNSLWGLIFPKSNVSDYWYFIDKRFLFVWRRKLALFMHRKSSFIPTIDFYEQVNDGHARIGLNLGLLPYYSTEDTASDRLGKRQRSGSPSSQVPMCQAEGCKADLSAAKHYHRRHKVCEFHSKEPTVIAGGHTQRFCQQCSRYAPIL